MAYRAGVIALFLTVFTTVALLGSDHGARRAAQAGNDDSPFNYEPYAEVLRAHVDGEGRVDYAALEADPGRLDAFIADLAALDPRRYAAWDEAQQLAFWLNAYNALTLKAVVDHYPVTPAGLPVTRHPDNAPRQIPRVGDTLAWPVMGTERTLDEIEREILRKDFDEPRIPMALSCASAGCPPLRNAPYRGEELDAQLEEQARKFLADPEPGNLPM